jgi:CheY-like chemotaxis protein
VAEILAVVDDLFFLAKIQQTAKLVGVSIETVAPDKLQECLAQATPRAIVIDLNVRTGSPVELVRALKNNPATRQLPVLAFLSHVQTDLAQAARAAGCDILLARSAFSQQLPQLLEKLARIEPASKDKAG